MTTKWMWKMDYCKANGLAPAVEEVWEEAETKWLEFIQTT